MNKDEGRTNDEDLVIDWGYWIRKLLSLLVIGAIIGLLALYIKNHKDQLAFTIMNPNAVSTCMAGYNGEHAEADRRFQLKQHSKVISPLADDVDEDTTKKALSQ